MSLGTLLHRKIYLTIMDGIQTGKYVDGDALPSEDSLASQFQVSRVTVRRALQDLVQAGVVERQQGRGTFIKLKGPSAQMFPVRRLQDHISSSARLSAALIECSYVVPNPMIAAALELEPGQQAQRMVRVRHDGNTPVLHLTTYVPEDIGRKIKVQELASRPLYELLAEQGWAYDHAEQSVAACLADPTVAPLLQVDVGAALMFLRRKLSSGTRPVEFLEIRASPEQYQIMMSWDVKHDREDAAPNNLTYTTSLSRL